MSDLIYKCLICPAKDLKHKLISNDTMFISAIISFVLCMFLLYYTSKMSKSKRSRKKELVMPLNIMAFASGLISLYLFFRVLDQVVSWLFFLKYFQVATEYWQPPNLYTRAQSGFFAGFDITCVIRASNYLDVQFLYSGI